MPESHPSPTHSIRVAARLSGLSPHVIRIWEKRYSVIKPHRTDTNRRVYSDQDVEKLRLLGSLTTQGHAIGNIAQLPQERLLELSQQTPLQVPSTNPPTDPTVGLEVDQTGRKADLLEFPAEASSGVNWKAQPPALGPFLDAIRRLDSMALDQLLTRSLLELGMQGFLIKLAAPLAQEMGEAWRRGDATAAHEHFTTASLKIFLGSHQRSFALSPTAPVIIVATPAGQLHELGAVIAGAAAANAGWRVIYLGANLPAGEIAGAANQHHAKVVALSIVYPCDDPSLPPELETLRALLPESTRIVVGGRAAHHYSQALDQIQAFRSGHLEGFFDWLNSVRTDTRVPVQSAR